MTGFERAGVRPAVWSACVLCLLAGVAGAAPMRVLNSFESQQDLRAWTINTGTPQLVADHATQGQRALEITFDPKGRYGAGYMTTQRPQDWTEFEAVQLDVFNPNDRPMAS